MKTAKSLPFRGMLWPLIFLAFYPQTSAALTFPPPPPPPPACLAGAFKASMGGRVFSLQPFALFDIDMDIDDQGTNYRRLCKK